jgi:hypothetical protein
VSPPKCPECGRFLKRTLVESLTADPTPCPRCETGLVASMYPDMYPDDRSVRPPDLRPTGRGSAATSAVGAEAVQAPPADPPSGPAPPATTEPPAVARPGADRGSVRPPDLVPVMVRDEPRDVLAGWDAGVSPGELDRWRDDRPPFPTDTVIVAGAGVAGAFVGALVPDRRGRNAAIGGLVGLLGAAMIRQVWRLDP